MDEDTEKPWSTCWNNYIWHQTRKPFLQFLLSLFFTLLHIWDMTSDVLYILGVDFFHPTFKIAAVFFLIAPLIFNMLIAYIKVNNACNRLNYWLLLTLNLINTRNKSLPDSNLDFAMNKLVFVVLEDFPQLLIQVINGLFVGAT